MSDAPFTKRLKAFGTRLALDTSTGALVVKDQMLVPRSASPVPIGPFKPTKTGLQVGRVLQSLGVKYKKLTTVFDRLPNPGEFEDVAILKLFMPKDQNVFKVTNKLRAKVLADAKQNASPNHVLVPAPNSLWCPYGPPSPADMPTMSPKGIAGQHITVIDSGYIWVPPSWGPAWGPNPLSPLATNVFPHEAQWLNLNDAGTAAVWQNGSHNVVDSNGDGKLDALAGHANFVAGVIAQHCELPNIHIWNHNSAFSYKPSAWDNFSTEAAICRSLVMSQQDTQTPVIQIGHETSVFENVASVVWQLAFDRIGYKRRLESDLILTCPAGNEGKLPGDAGTIPRIPAAFGVDPAGANPPFTFSGPTFPWVKGVASFVATATPPQASGFSNHGGWVACSANGENVVSSFLYVNMPVEESTSTAPRNFEPDSWASWNGTSFAAPKIAGEIVAQLSPSVNASQAWANLVACTNCTSVPGYGIVFPF
jgi:subtilase family protein